MPIYWKKNNFWRRSDKEKNVNFEEEPKRQKVKDIEASDSDLDSNVEDEDDEEDEVFRSIGQSKEPNERAVDCSTCEYAISTDLTLLESLVMESDGRCIIVAQRDGVFYRYATSPKFIQRIPSIILTAKGYPDTATRFLLHRKSKAFPDLPSLALVDWYGSPIYSPINAYFSRSFFHLRCLH
ncbi:hypothetical protein PTKIN_Ptkin16aG0025900 [Pterospermum kingtungense]